MTRYASATEAARAVQDAAQNIRGYRKALVEQQNIYDNAQAEYSRLTSLDGPDEPGEPLRPIGLTVVPEPSPNTFDEPGVAAE